MRAAAALIALLSTGCSVMLVDRPPETPDPDVYPHCHENSGALVADLLLMVIDGALALSVATEENEEDKATAVGILGGMAVAHGLSGWAGLRWTHRCGQQRRDWSLRHPDAGPVTVEPLRKPPPRPAEGSRGAACFPNRTCNDGLACDPQGRCVAGDRGLEGRPCFDDGSCSGDLSCSSGMCARPPTPECAADSHCPEGRVCQGGYCLVPPSP